MNDNIKITLVAVCAAINAFLVNRFGVFTPLLYLVICLMISDLITRAYAAGVRSDEKIQSKKVMEGLYKKIGLVLLIGFSLLVDKGFLLISNTLGIDVGTKVMVTALTLAWLFIRESISNLENLQHANIDLPLFLVKALNLAKDRVDHLGDSIVEGGNKNE